MKDMHVAGLLICTERNSGSGLKKKKILLSPKGTKKPIFYSRTSLQHIKEKRNNPEYHLKATVTSILVYILLILLFLEYFFCKLVAFIFSLK